MTDKQNIDEKIAKLVKSVEADIPVAVEERLQAGEETPQPRHKILGRRPVLCLGVLSSAVAVLLLILFLLPLFQGVSETQISEIRTEFELRDKNIKIIFIHTEKKVKIPFRYNLFKCFRN